MSEVMRETREFPAVTMKELDSLVVRATHGVFTEEMVCGVGFCQPLEGMQGQEAPRKKSWGGAVQSQSLEQCLLGYCLWDPCVLWPGILAVKHHNASPWVEFLGRKEGLWQPCMAIRVSDSSYQPHPQCPTPAGPLSSGAG